MYPTLKAWLLLAVVLLAGGCATLPSPPTLEEITQMSKQGVPADQIIKRMQDSRAIYRLSGSQLAKLHEQGVSDAVIDYMYESQLDAVRREFDPYFYGMPPYFYRPWYYGRYPYWW